jgi:hypothetical protein
MAKNSIFLSGNELEVISEKCATIHLKNDDRRSILIDRLLFLGELRKNTWQSFSIITINPRMLGYGSYFAIDEWYVIPEIIYSSKCSFRGYNHYAISYRLTCHSKYERNAARLLTTKEIDKYKRHQVL